MERTHAEYRREPPGADTALVFIHGICGSPRQFDFLIEGPDERFAVYNLLLPGHGGSLRDFNRSGMDRWQTYVDETVSSLESRYDRIILTGHSMGCLLSLHYALQNPDSVSGLFLMAPPLAFGFRSQCFKNNLVIALGLQMQSPSIDAARRFCSVTARNPAEHLLSLPRYLELVQTGHSLRKRISGLGLPILALHLAEDELVSRRSLRYFSQPQARTLIIPDAQHYFFPPKAREQVTDAFYRFIGEISPSK